MSTKCQSLPGQKTSLDLAVLCRLQQPPLLWEPGASLFWNDPHISSQMLACHLNPDIEAASRPPDVIDRSVAWLVKTLDLRLGAEVLDLGCGPGLYAARLAQRGLRVTGLDLSERSIAYAIEYAQARDLHVTYRCQNYLTLEAENEFDAVLLIYGDLCPLPPAQRDSLLDRVCRALKPGGHFVFDVTTRRHRARQGLRHHWYVAEAGFWRPEPHLVLEQGFDYPEQAIYLDQYIVIEQDGSLSVYRNWFQDYSPETIREALAARGFVVEALYADLTGTPYTPESEWIGVMAACAEEASVERA